MTRAIALLVVLLAAVPVSAAVASQGGLTSEQVAKEIVRLQAKADRTATAWAEAQGRLEDLSVEIADAQTAVDQTSAAQSQIETQLANIAIDRFMNGGASSPNLFFSDPIDELQTQALASAVVNQGATNIDDIEQVRADLQDQQAHLVALQNEDQRLSDQMSANQADLEQQLAALALLKGQLVDEETRRAYEAELAKQRAKEAQQRQEAADAAAAAAAEAARAAAAREAPLVAAPSVAAVATAPPTTAAPATVAPTTDAGRSPAATTPQPAAVAPLAAAPAPVATAPEPPPPVLVGGDWLCPVAGPNAFGDTWGAPRSGGRKHLGVDMMSPYGTPVVAVVSGFSTPKVNSLGGNTLSLVGDDGNRYYYAHLSAWEGGARAVAQGEVLGYVGHTGDTTANHLHFEIHPGGGAAVNPYPTVRAHC